QCAVVGVPDPQWGEVGVAAVVLRPGAQASPDELLAHLRGQLARYKVPKRVELLDALPLSGMGKILKRELRRTYSPGPSR
ncbi:MAG TPA: fatty acid--CoA ligase, partial [Anaerolineales bacterium]|nr:fatty acid--CoA ligase [Anaerolineales bacterium]